MAHKIANNKLKCCSSCEIYNDWHLPVFLLKVFHQLKNVFMTMAVVKYFNFLQYFSSTVLISFLNNLQKMYSVLKATVWLNQS